MIDIGASNVTAVLTAAAREFKAMHMLTGAEIKEALQLIADALAADGATGNDSKTNTNNLVEHALVYSETAKKQPRARENNNNGMQL